MIEIFDRSRRRVAIAENAHAVSEQQRINAVWYLDFSLPYQDPKNEYCKPFYHVRHDGGELYRIMPETLTVDGSGSVSYRCEHVLATLIDNILFGYHVVGNRGTYTADAIRYVLGHQLVKDWVLDECDYRNQFEYGWEQESLLSALFSVATPLAGPYMWRTDTSVYPWRLSLKRLDTAGRPEMYVRQRHNMTSYRRSRDPQHIVTRLYPLGYGEGVNQLGIESVNGGVPYLQSPKAITDRYGIVERVWTDRRYEDPGSLKAAAQAMLQQLQEPTVSHSIGYQEMGASSFDKAAIGKRVRIVCPEIGESVDTFITEIRRDYEDVERSSLVVANKETSIASSLADMADRQRIEQTYAQGATQIYSQALQANCDRSSGAVMDFFIPEEMRIINKVLVKVRMTRFRAYSKSTQSAASQVVTSTTSDDETRTSSGGGRTTSTTTTSDDQTRTSSDGGGTRTTTTNSDDQTSTSTNAGHTTVTSTSGGGCVATSAGGGGTTTDTGPGGVNVKWEEAATKGANDHFHYFSRVSSHQHEITLYDHVHSVTVPEHGHTVELPGHDHEVTIRGHSHEVAIQDHRHTITIPGHHHKVTVPDHKHTITIPGHSHEVTVPAHAHQIEPGIYEFGDPKQGSIYIDGTKRADFSGRSAELDITALLVGSDNRIPRGNWLSLEVRPDDLAYISIDLIVQGFIQSRGDKTV